MQKGILTACLLFLIQNTFAQFAQTIPNPITGTVNNNFNSGDNVAWVEYNSKLYYLFDLQNGKFQLGAYSVATSTNQLIPNVSPTDVGPQDAQIVFNNKLYTIYATSSGKQQLAEFNGSSYTLYANPDNGNGLIGYPIVYNNKLYYKYKDVNAKARLVSFNGAAVSLIANPATADPGFHNNPIVYNSKLYFSYKKSTGKNVLAQYDGTTITLINNPNTTDAGFHSSEPIIYGGKLCLRYTGNGVKNNLATFDGTTLTIINNPSTFDLGYNGKPVLFNNKLFITYGDASIPTKYQLASWNGTSLTLISNPTSSTGVLGYPVVMGTKLYFGYIASSTMNQLVSYDGASFNVFSNPSTADKGIVDGIIPEALNGGVFFNYQLSSGGYRMAKCNGTSITLFNNPDAGQPFTDLTPLRLTPFSNYLFLNYAQPGGSRQLALLNTCSTSTITITDSVCNNAYYSFNGQLYNTAGNYTATFTSSTGCDSIVTLHLTTYACTNTNLKCYIQGYYSNGTMPSVLLNSGVAGASVTDCDFVRVELHGATAPYNLVTMVNAMLKTNGTLICPIPPNLANLNYYLAIRHRNGLETWSSLPVLMNANTHYDFTTSANKAYGGNQVLVATNIYAIFNGDMNHDGAIDAFDYLIMDPDIQQGNSGYLISDLNGDGSVDIFDDLKLEPNIANGIGLSRP